MYYHHLILFVQFGDEFQIGTGQILFDPLVDLFVQFRTETTLPVTRFALKNKMSFVHFLINF